MPGLNDVAPSFRTVSVKNVAVDVTGISALGIAYLFSKFPVVKELIGGRDVQMGVEDIVKLAPEAIAAIIACGTGSINDPAAEATAANLGAEAQLNLLEAIIGETLPNGIGPFVEKLEKMFKGLGVESMSIPAGQSQQVSKP